MRKGNVKAAGIQELTTLFTNLQGLRIPRDPNDKAPYPAESHVAEIDCCDVVSGDCNSGACVAKP